MPTAKKTFEYKLYRCRQTKYLAAHIELAAEIYNHCIALHRRYYKLTGKYISANRMKVHLTKLKRQRKYAHWNKLNSQAIQDIAERIDRSYRAFFEHRKAKRRGKKSKPRFCKRSRYKSFTLKQTGYKFLEDNRVSIMGRTYKYSKHRDLEGTIKTVTVKRNALGEYFIYVVCDVEVPEIMPRMGKTTGYDFGVKCFMTDNDGCKIRAPEFYKRSLGELRKKQRVLSHKEDGSKNRKRARLDLERAHRKVANQRKDWLNKLALELASRSATICIEDLNIKAWQRMWGRKVSDYGISACIRSLENACAKTGSTLVKIGRWEPSSKTCHDCGAVYHELQLKDREWTCPVCGKFHDRDINAAKNIRDMGLAQLLKEA